MLNFVKYFIENFTSFYRHNSTFCLLHNLKYAFPYPFKFDFISRILLSLVIFLVNKVEIIGRYINIIEKIITVILPSYTLNKNNDMLISKTKIIFDRINILILLIIKI